MRTDNTAEHIDFTGELKVAANASGSGSVSASATADFFGSEIIVDTGERGFDIRATADGGTGVEAGQSRVYAAGSADAKAWAIFQVCRYLVKDFGTSQSPKSTRQRDSRYCPDRPALIATPSRTLQQSCSCATPS
ncbi:MAG: hypothetical protein G8D58_01840 [gamma proteobacterium symbiont of Phacoides pectinatus]